MLYGNRSAKKILEPFHKLLYWPRCKRVNNIIKTFQRSFSFSYRFKRRCFQRYYERVAKALDVKEFISFLRDQRFAYINYGFRCFSLVSMVFLSGLWASFREVVSLNRFPRNVVMKETLFNQSSSKHKSNLSSYTLSVGPFLIYQKGFIFLPFNLWI